MRIYFSQLSKNLKQGIGSLYLLSGDEPLQQMEGGDMIRNAARAAGTVQRDVFYIDRKTQWVELDISVRNASLFSEKRLVEIYFGETQIKKEASVFLKSYIENLPADTVLLVRTNKIDRRQAWVKRFEDQGVVVQIYNKNLSDLQGWVRERLLQEGMRTEEHVVELIAMRVEGNMLAAAQAVQQLKLLCQDEVVQLEDVEHSVELSANYSPYHLCDAVIVGDVEKAMHILNRLRLDQAPIPLIVWAVASELRKMALLEKRRLQGESIDSLIRTEWRNKKDAVRCALGRRLGLRWETLLVWCARVDKACKGLSTTGEEVWNELFLLLLKTCRVPSLMEGKRSA